MKRFLLTVLSLFLVQWLSAFDWQPKPTAALYQDMMAKAREFRSFAEGTPAGDRLSSFIRDMEYIESEKPFAWISETYKLVAELEQMYPPQVDKGSDDFTTMVRRYTMWMVDFPVHVNDQGDMTAEERQAFDSAKHKYTAGSCKEAIKWLKRPAPEPGVLAIYKVYNMGFIFRTSERAFAIDLRWWGTAGEARQIAKLLDVVFITHPHGDHYSLDILNAMVDAGKLCVLSKDLIPKAKSSGKLIIWDDIVDPVDVRGIKMRLFAGNQGKDVPNNIYHLEFDGWTVIHNGDNSDKPREGRYAELSAPDIVIGATWNRFQIIQDAAKEAAAKDGKAMIFLPGHENEFGHRVQQRESYREAYDRDDRFNNPDYDYIPWMLLDLGEEYVFTKDYLKSIQK